MRSTVIAAGLAFGMASGVAQAAIIDFSYDVGSVAVSGMLTATNEGGGNYLATSISGTRGDSMITGLSSYASADNMIDLNQPYVTFSGLSFSFAGTGSTGTGTANLGSYAGGYTEVTNPPDPVGYLQNSLPATNVSFTLAAVPLPTSAPMFGAALIAFGAAGYAAKRKQVAAAA